MAIDKIVRNIVEDDAVTEPKIAAGAVDNTAIDKTIVSGLSELTDVADNDALIIYDTSADALKKITKSRTTGFDFPTYTSVSPTSSQTVDGGSITFTITGSGFTAGTNARLISNTGVRLNFDSVTRTNATTISATIARSSLLVAQSPYDIQVINGEGLSVVGANQISIDTTPVFVTSAGSLGTVTEGDAVDIEVIARDPDSSSSITFEIQSGSLPAGLSLVNQSGDSCRITGTASAVSSDTTSNFTLRAFDASSNTVSRAFSITVSDFSMNSARFDIDTADSLTRTLGTPTNGKIFTISTWIKVEGESANAQEIMAGGTDGSNETFLRYTSNETIQFRHDHASDTNWQLQTTQKLRDPAAWYHLVAAVDTTQSTSTNRVKLYLNGSQITDLSTSNYPAQNEETFLNKSAAVSIGKQNYTTSGYFGGYLSDFNFIDGTALTPTSFGETDSNGVWVPKNPSGLTYGNNGFRLDFADSADLGDDESGKGNDFTENNLTSIDKTEDTPLNNYAVLNTVVGNEANLSATSDGNLNVLITSGGAIPATIGFDKGKWYWEVEIDTQKDYTQLAGIINESHLLSGNVGATSTSWGYFLQGNTDNGKAFHNNTPSSVYQTVSNGDILQIAVDYDNSKIWFGVNGTYVNSGNPATGSNAVYTNISSDQLIFPAITNYLGTGSGTPIMKVNFGAPIFSISSSNSDANGYGSFEYAVP